LNFIISVEFFGKSFTELGYISSFFLILLYFQSHNIEYILNLSLQIPKPATVQDSHFMRIPVHDSPNEKLLPHFLQAFEFLGELSKAFLIPFFFLYTPGRTSA
jgi:hypothetical protein